VIAPAPASHRDDLEGETLKFGEVSGEPEGDFADGEPVPHGKRIKSNEGPELWIHEGTFQCDSIYRVGAVQNPYWRPGSCGDLHQFGEGPDEGVVAGADILKVNDDSVQIEEVAGVGRQRFRGRTVKRDDGKAEERVFREARSERLQVLMSSPDSVFWSKEGKDANA
jgi:hypothetical protein